MTNTPKYPLLYNFAIFQWAVVHAYKNYLLNLIEDTWLSKTPLFTYLEAKKNSYINDTYAKLAAEQDSRHEQPKQSL